MMTYDQNLVRKQKSALESSKQVIMWIFLTGGKIEVCVALLSFCRSTSAIEKNGSASVVISPESTVSHLDSLELTLQSQ